MTCLGYGESITEQAIYGESMKDRRQELANQTFDILVTGAGMYITMPITKTITPAHIASDRRRDNGPVFRKLVIAVTSLYSSPVLSLL